MSHAAIAAVLARDDLAAGERLVAWSLASFANRDQRAWPGVPAAAARAGLSRSRYLELRDQLVRAGLLEIKTPGVGRGRASTVNLLFAQAGPWHEDEVNVDLLEAVLGYSPARGPARLLLAALAALADQNGNVDGLTTDELCRAAGMANSTYRRARRALLASGEVTVDGDGGGRGWTCHWTVRRPAHVAPEPAIGPKRLVAPRPGVRPLVAAATSGAGSHAENGPILSGVSAEKGPIAGGVSPRKGPIPSGVWHGKGPSLSGVSDSNPAKTPPQTPPPNVRAGREPRKPRTTEDPPTPLKGGNDADSVFVEQTFVTDRGRTRRRLVPVDLNEIRRNLNMPAPGDRTAWQSIRAQLFDTVGESTFAIWLEPIELIAVGNERELVLATHEQTASWVRVRFGRLIVTCAQRIGRQVRLAAEPERRAVERSREDEHPGVRDMTTDQKEAV